MDFNKVLTDGEGSGADLSLDHGFKKLIEGKLDLAREDFARYDDEIQKMRLEVEGMDIGGEADAAYLTSLLGSAQKLVRGLEEERKLITRDAYDFYKTVMAFEKQYSDKIKVGIIQEGKRKLGEYAHKKEIERRAAEKRAQEAARAKQEELDRMADEAEVARVKVDVPVVPQESGSIRSETGTASTRMVWTYEMLDKKKVPRKYCIPDHKAIMEAIKAGVRKISGLRIFEEAKVTLRSR